MPEDEDTKNLIFHLEQHIDYPATKSEIINSFTEEDPKVIETKRRLKNRLPDDETFQDASRIRTILGL